MADAAAVEAAAAEVESRLGPIDVWINTAMASVFWPVRETTADDYRRVTEGGARSADTLRNPPNSSLT